MKSMVAVIGFLLLTSSMSNAQFNKGDLELSFSGSLGSTTDKSTGTYLGNSSSDSQTEQFLFFSISPGYYLLDGLSVEPEISLMAVQHAQPAQYFLLNLSYTYLPPNSKAALFVRAGYGISNSIQVPMMGGGTVVQMSDKFDIGVINLGAGAKFLLTQSVVLRAEVNYRSHAWSSSEDFGYGSYKYDYVFSHVGLLVGFSILL
ncbi:MAG TPA: outer membrane beta-barrel protein [Candidatus Acidoferrales bacterium]|nr:outer membrane beta-barrel protein [Candidatus Acidoferrales bacterium]